ncbi:hypothetical protein VE02_07114 [Pseudogymnoascus sp. 03VT05]|nr:hypothetical protein VE02_07114 [Pseudogymnoascus sp. 03VT05]
MSFGFSVGDIIAVASLANKIRQRLFDNPEQFKAIATDGVRGLSIVLQDADIALSEKELTGQLKTELDGISDFIARRQEGTGQWLLDSDRFQYWLNQSNQILFCPGMPGAGKTMMASIVVDHLYGKYLTDTNVGIAYLYCNFRRQDEQRPIKLLASLLKRLIERQHTLPNSMKDLYDCYKSKQTRPSFKEISKELQSVIASFSTTFIVIDALDECQFPMEIRHIEEFQGAPSLEIRASDGDVRRYLDGQSPRLPSFVRRNLDMQEQINAEIIKAVDGMFLLAQLHLETLIGKRSPKAIRAALEKLPTGSEAYDYAYKEAMRPLTTLELQHALAVEIGQSSLDEENLPDIEDVVSVCAGLVTIDEESDIIRLVHYTTQEYFDRNWTSWFPNAHEAIAKTCVTYLLFSTFESGFCSTDEEFDERMRLNPLYNYAARNWGHYDCAGSTEVEELILDFLQNDAAVSASSQAAVVSRDYPSYDRSVPKEMRGTHLAAYFGLKKMMTNLLRKGHHPDSKDSYDYTPLLWAALKGHDGVVKLLLDEAGVNVNSMDKYSRTPLFLAADHGDGEVVKLLLATTGIDVNSGDIEGTTPLSIATNNGHESVVKLLLAKAGVNLSSMDQYYRTPLFLAAQYGHEEVVKLLLVTAGIDVNSRDVIGTTPVSVAAQKGYVEVVKLLLATAGVNVDSKNSNGWTALWMAAMNGHEEVVRLLLATPGVNVDSEDTDGETPLSIATSRGHVEVVKLLKSGGAMTD